ncbi:MAG: hypothetical protein QM498_12185 [Desulfobacterium sp.]
MECRKKYINSRFSLGCPMAGCRDSQVRFPCFLPPSRPMHASQTISAHHIPESNIKIHQYLASFIFQFTRIGAKIPFFTNYFQKTVKYFWDHMKDVQYITQIIKHTIPGRLRDRVAGAFFRYCNNVAPFPKMIASIGFGGATGLRRDLIMVKISRSLSGNLTKLKTFFQWGFPQKTNCAHIKDHVSLPPVSCKYLPPPSSGKKTLPEQPVSFLTHFKKRCPPITHWKGRNRQKNAFKSGSDFFSRRLPSPNWVTTGRVGFSDMDLALPLISHKTAKNGIPAVRTIAFDKIMWNFSEVSQDFIGSAVVFSFK